MWFYDYEYECTVRRQWITEHLLTMSRSRKDATPEEGKMDIQSNRKSNTRIQHRLEWNLNSRNLKKTSTIIYLAASSIALEKLLISIITWLKWWEVRYFTNSFLGPLIHDYYHSHIPMRRVTWKAAIPYILVVTRQGHQSPMDECTVPWISSMT